MLAAHAFLAASIGPRRSLQFASLVPPNDACVDTHEMCAQWAAAGECENNPSFMLTGCADSCTKCKEGPSGVGQLRTPAERNRRKDRWCGNLDDNCERRAEAGACHNGSDAPLRCPGSCRACGFKSILEEAYACDIQGSLSGRLFPSLSERNCERKRKRCARPPNTPSAVEPGSISRTMRRILSDFPQFSPRALSYPGSVHGKQAPWVMSLQNFVSSEEANAFIEGCAEHFDRSLAGDQLSPVRTSTQCWCSGNKCGSSAITQAVAHRIANITQVPSERYFEPFQVLRYEPGQFYRSHHDQNSGLFTPQGPRLYTFFIYLSTPEEGGGTRFTDLGITVPAVKGNAVLWPSLMDSDPDMDEPLTHHEGLPPETGIKYASNVWVHTHDFKTPASLQCPLSFKNTH